MLSRFEFCHAMQCVVYNAGLFLELFSFLYFLSHCSDEFLGTLMVLNSGMSPLVRLRCILKLETHKKGMTYQKRGLTFGSHEKQGATECILERPESSSSLLHHGDQL